MQRQMPTHPLQLTLGHNPFVMVRVDTDTLTLEIKCELTESGMSKFILVQVWPAPYSGINHMRKAFTASHLKFNSMASSLQVTANSLVKVWTYLKPAIQSSGNGYTRGITGSIGSDSRD